MALTQDEIQEVASVVNLTVENSVKCAVNAAVNKELGQYKVPKEQHYQDHLWLKEFRELIDGIKKVSILTFVKNFIKLICWLIAIGLLVALAYFTSK